METKQCETHRVIDPETQKEFDDFVNELIAETGPDIMRSDLRHIVRRHLHSKNPLILHLLLYYTRHQYDDLLHKYKQQKIAADAAKLQRSFNF